MVDLEKNKKASNDQEVEDAPLTDPPTTTNERAEPKEPRKKPKNVSTKTETKTTIKTKRKRGQADSEPLTEIPTTPEPVKTDKPGNPVPVATKPVPVATKPTPIVEAEIEDEEDDEVETDDVADVIPSTYPELPPPAVIVCFNAECSI